MSHAYMYAFHSSGYAGALAAKNAAASDQADDADRFYHGL